MIVEPADAGVARDCLVVQYVAAVSDGVDRDGSNEALFDRETRGAAHRWGAAAEQAAESGFGFEKTPGVASGIKPPTTVMMKGTRTASWWLASR